jgi:Phosphodiester glycosidase
LNRNTPANHLLPRLLTALMLSTFLIAGAGGQADTTIRTLAPGIVYTQEITTGSAPLVINVLRVDLRAPGVRVQTGQAQDVVSLNGPSKGRETVHNLAIRHNALAAINADFFPFTGDPLGLAVRDGELISEPSGYRACLGFTPSQILLNVLVPIGALVSGDGATLELSGINRVPHDGDTVILTPTYAATPTVEKNGFVVTLRDVFLPIKLSQPVQGVVDSVAPIGSGEQISQTTGQSVQIVALGAAAGQLPAHCKRGDTVTFRFDVIANTAPPTRGRYASRAGNSRMGRYVPIWTDVQQAVGGGPMLVRDGQIAIDGEAEGLPRADFVDKRHPRTAAGVDDRGNLLLVTVDGRATWSRGASLDEMAAIMKRYGAVQALNLDGGGSTTMAIGGGVVNAPSDGRERPIADGLLIYGNTPDVPDTDALRIAANAAVDMDGAIVHVGDPIRFQVVDMDGKPIRAEQIIWGTGDGLGFVTQQGVFTCQHVGIGAVSARVGSRVMTVSVNVMGGTPARITARLSPVPDGGPERNLLFVMVQDKFGNPVTGQRILVEALGLTVQTPLVTDKKGAASGIVVWSVPLDKRLLTVTASQARSAPLHGDSVHPLPPPLPDPIDPDNKP